MKSASESASAVSGTPADALLAWARNTRPRFDALEPRADFWSAIAEQLPPQPVAASSTANPTVTSTFTAPLPATDQLRAWTQQHRAAFDVVEPRADLWPHIEGQLYPADAAPAARPFMTPARGGRPAWWQMAAAAVVVFGLGYGVRLGTEPAADVSLVAADQTLKIADEDGLRSLPVVDANLHVARPRHGFRNQEPDPAVQAAVLASTVQRDDAENGTTTENAEMARVMAETARAARTGSHTALAPEIARLEARYAALITRHRTAAQHRFVPTHALAEEWDREMAVLDSAYAALRQELPRNPRTDDVVAAMSRNLHLRLKLLHQQMMALDAVQQVRQRASSQLTPRRPPTVNPDDNGSNIEDGAPGASGGGTLVPPAPPAPESVPGLGARVAPRPLRAA